jgi:uncharacterized pyridoxamine 5'-phosphate oxidase family protein
MNSAAIIDLDGTLVDVSSIRYLVEGKKKNFDQFHLDSAKCPPKNLVVKITQKLFENGFKIFILSGRVEKYRELSVNWLSSYNIDFHELHLRKNNDFRDDVTVKKEMFENLKGNDFVVAIDDREKLRELWKSLQIPNVIDPESLSELDFAIFLHELGI